MPLLFKANMEKGKGPSPLHPITIIKIKPHLWLNPLRNQQGSIQTKLWHICNNAFKCTPSGHYCMHILLISATKQWSKCVDDHLEH
jgi:hypothetical protein